MKAKATWKDGLPDIETGKARWSDDFRIQVERIDDRRWNVRYFNEDGRCQERQTFLTLALALAEVRKIEERIKEWTGNVSRKH